MCVICRSEINENTTAIRACSKVTYIPYLPNLTHLETDWCYELRDIPPLPKLKYLDCRFSKVKHLSDFPELEYLDCAYCHELLYICGCPKVRSLQCGYCKNLRKISEMDIVESYGLWECPKLTSIPSRMRKGFDELRCMKWIHNVVQDSDLRKILKCQSIMRRYISKRRNLVCKQLWLNQDLWNLVLGYV